MYRDFEICGKVEDMCVRTEESARSRVSYQWIHATQLGLEISLCNRMRG